jgi:hypothetical protein
MGQAKHYDSNGHLEFLMTNDEKKLRVVEILGQMIEDKSRQARKMVRDLNTSRMLAHGFSQNEANDMVEGIVLDAAKLYEDVACLSYARKLLSDEHDS